MQRKRHSADFKAKVTLEAIKEQKTLNEIAKAYEVHPVQISKWKKQMLDALPEVFSSRKARSEAEEEVLTATLYQQIGQLKVELDWLKKNLALTPDEKRCLIERGHPELSIARQCELMGLARSSWYYQPASESKENLSLMRLIDEEYTQHPFYGSRRMVATLQRQGYEVVHPRPAPS